MYFIVALPLYRRPLGGAFLRDVEAAGADRTSAAINDTTHVPLRERGYETRRLPDREAPCASERPSVVFH
jgi:hypothetical protein